MNRGTFFAKIRREDSQESEEKCKAFEDISTYFSKEDWAKLGNTEKEIYVSMKRNYDTMTCLGLHPPVPLFMRPKIQTIKSEDDSDEDWDPRNQDKVPQGVPRVQEREFLMVSPKSEEAQRLSPSKDVNMEMPMNPTMEENVGKSLPLTPGQEPALKELCPSGKASVSGEENQKMPGPRKVRSNIWAHRLRERKYHVVYEEISDPSEDD